MLPVPQVEDDPELLRTMMADLDQATALFRPTNYWAVYEQRFVPELLTRGLHDFRRRRGSVVARFGAGDLKPRGAYVDLSLSRLFGNRVTNHIPGWRGALRRLSELLNRRGYSPAALDVYECRLRDLQESAFRLTQLYGERTGARPLEMFEPSLAGNPEDVFEVSGTRYTFRSLYYYLRYAYCCQFIDFESITLLVELGSGVGRQIEVIRKLHPHIRIIAFDIPPQLYVCERFLSTVFPNAVISYATTRSYDSLPDLPDGAIVICGTAKFPLIEHVRVDLFWNAVSFQEMEPEVVGNYLRYVDPAATAVYLQQRMGGKELAERLGLPGVLHQTTLDDYRRGLPTHKMIDMSPCLRPLGMLQEHRDSFWRRT